jgi:hypothetical protein
VGAGADGHAGVDLVDQELVPSSVQINIFYL